MGLRRDLSILGLMIIVLVASTYAWSVYEIPDVWTAEAVSYVTGPVQVNSISYVVSNYRTVTLSVTVQNTNPVPQTITVEAQPVDLNGDLILESLIQIQTPTLSAGETRILTFIFDYEYVDRRIGDFLFVITGDGYILRTSANAIGSSTATIAITGYSQTTTLSAVPRARLLTPPWTQKNLNQANWKVQQVRTAFNPNWKSRFEIVAVTLGVDAGNTQFEICAYVFNGINWSQKFLLGQGTLYTGNPQVRPFDVAYEGTSSRAVVVWNSKKDNLDGTKDLGCQVWNGETWLPQTLYIDTGTGADDFSYVKLETNPTTNSNQIALIGMVKGTPPYVKCFIWSGSAWGNRKDLTDTTSAAYDDRYESFDIAYERTTGNLVAAAAYKQASPLRYYVRWLRYKSTGWDASFNSVQMTPAGSTLIYWVSLKPRNWAGSNNMMVLAVDVSSGTGRLYAKTYTAGTTPVFGSLVTVEASIESYTTRVYDGDWDPVNQKFLVVFGDRQSDGGVNWRPINYRTYTASSGVWSSLVRVQAAQVPEVTTALRWVEVRANLKSALTPAVGPPILVGVIDYQAAPANAGYLTIMRWTGTQIDSTSGPDGQFTTQSSILYEAFEIACSWP